MLANIIIDVLIALLIVLCAIIGAKKGFFLTATKPVKWFAAIILAFTLSSSAATGIVQPMIEAPITNQITDFLTDKCDDLTPENAKEELPTLIKLAAGLADINIESITGETKAEFISQTVDKLAKPVIYLISVIIAFFAIYFLSKVLLAVLLKILNGIFDRGVIGVVNKILGSVIGAFFAFVTAWLFVIVFGYVVSMPSIAGTEFGQSFSGGYIYKFIKSMSPLDLLLSF